MTTNTRDAVQLFLANRSALNRTPRTIEFYESLLIPFAAACPELPTQPEPIESFLASCTKPEHEQLRHGYYRSLKALYRFLERRYRIPNPISLIDPPIRHKKVKPTLSSSQLMHLLAQAITLRDQAILSLFIDTGVRVGEAASLKKNGIFEEHIIVSGKTGEREVPISPETRHSLLVLAHSSSSDSPYLFQGKRGHLTVHGISQIVEKHMRAAGIHGPKLGPHRIRHSFGRAWVTNGGDLRSLQIIMGHANISTTEIYVGLSGEDIAAKHRQFTPLRTVHAAAQESLWREEVLKEAEQIVTVKGEEPNSQDKSKAVG